MIACHDTCLYRAGILILPLLLAGILVRPAPAADADESEPERYAVEIIVFEHLDQSRNTAEQPLLTTVTNDIPQPAAPERAEAGDVIAADALNLNDSGQPPNEASSDMQLRNTRPQPLPSDLFRMNTVFKRLRRLNAYRPILHIGWIQPASPRDEAQAKQIALQPATGLSGQVQLYKERFLHLAVRMKLQQPVSGYDQPAKQMFVNGPAVIDESRRLRGDKAQYFDNPRFGVLAKVWKLPAEMPATSSQPAVQSPPGQ